MGRDIYKPYFSHDIYARQDAKIKNMLLHFRKESNLKAQAAVCIYWYIVEDMHKDDYKISDLEAYADDYRCDIDFLKSILEDFDLFRIENDCYISDRVLRNIEEQSEKSKKSKAAANKRWNKKNKEESKLAPDLRLLEQEEFIQGAEEPDEDFNKFWELCPNKIDKYKTRTQYRCIITEGIATAEEIANGMKRYKDHVTSNELEPRYIISPLKWLLSRKWSDTYPDKPHKKSILEKIEELERQEELEKQKELEIQEELEKQKELENEQDGIY